MTCRHILFSTLKFYPAMVPMLGLIFIDGLNIGIQASTIIHLITNADNKENDDLLSGIAIMVSGVGSLAGGYVGSKLCDRFKPKKVALAGVLLYASCCLTFMAASFLKCYPLTLAVFFYYGFESNYISGCEMVICS